MQAILPVTVPMHQSVTIVVFQGELAAHVSYFVFEELLPCVPHKIPLKFFQLCLGQAVPILPDVMLVRTAASYEGSNIEASIQT